MLPLEYDLVGPSPPREEGNIWIFPRYLWVLNFGPKCVVSMLTTIGLWMCNSVFSPSIFQSEHDRNHLEYGSSPQEIHFFLWQSVKNWGWGKYILGSILFGGFILGNQIRGTCCGKRHSGNISFRISWRNCSFYFVICYFVPNRFQITLQPQNLHRCEGGGQTSRKMGCLPTTHVWRPIPASTSQWVEAPWFSSTQPLTQSPPTRPQHTILHTQQLKGQVIQLACRAPSGGHWVVQKWILTRGFPSTSVLTLENRAQARNMKIWPVSTLANSWAERMGLKAVFEKKLRRIL